jgi:hypothetical protein
LPCWTQFRFRPSGGELLAAARAPRRDDPAAAHRAHASPKTMPALADELARLIGAFHGTNSKLTAANLKIWVSGTGSAVRAACPREKALR